MKSLSVKQFNQYIKTSFKHDPLFQNISIKGEIANYKVSHSHIYFSLKEDNEIIDCVIYYYEDKDFMDFDNGDEVIIYGNLIYNSYFSKISISVNKIEKKGISEEYIKFLEKKEEFSKKGYFDLDKKKEICEYPKKIGLITSDKSAAIVDFLSVINKEVSDINIYLYPVKVQGLGAKNEILNAIGTLDRKKLDVIVITRGGGSKEDLKVFNEEEIVEKIYRTKTPIISAIGHKIDLSLTDLVSDLSLQTPTEAGSYLIKDYKNLKENINRVFFDVKKTLYRNIELKELELRYFKKNLDSYSIDSLLDRKSKELDSLFSEFKLKLILNIKEKEDQVSILNLKLESIKSIIDVKKNSIYIKNLDDELIFSKFSLKNKDKVKIIFSDGEVKAEIYDR